MNAIKVPNPSNPPAPPCVEKLVRTLYYLGSEARSIDKNSWPTAEEAIHEAQRVANKLMHAIPIYLLVNGVSVRYCLVKPDKTISFDSHIFTDGCKVVDTILAITDELCVRGKTDAAILAAQTLTDLALLNESTAGLLTKQDYEELLGKDIVEDIVRKAENNTDAFFATMSRIDNIIDSQKLPISEQPITTLQDVLDGYSYTITNAPEEAKKAGLPELVKTLGAYVHISSQI